MMFRFCSVLLALAAVTAGPGCSLTAGKSAVPAGSGETGQSPAVSTAPAAPATSPAESNAKAAEKNPPAANASSAASGAEKPTQPAKVYKPISPECQSLFQQIEELEKGIPVRFSGLKRPAEEIYKDILACMELCQRFLAQCPDMTQACDAKAILARLRLASFSRYQDELRRDKNLTEAERTRKHQERIQETLTLAETTAAECGSGSRARKVALQTCVDLYEKLELYEKVRATADLILKEYPNYEGRPSLHLSYGQSLLNERRYIDAVKFWRDVIKEHADDVEYVAYNDKLFEALTGAGDLEAMEELMHLEIVEYPIRLLTVPPDHNWRGQYEQWMCIAPFWIGFVRMALGDADGAREWFKKQVVAANVRVKQIVDQGKGAGNDVCNIFSQFRSQDMLYWFDEFYGKAPQCDFDLGELWATEQQITLKESAGKVAAVLFRLPEDRRSTSYLQGLDALVKSHEKDGLAALTLGHVAGNPNPAEDAMMLQKMRDDLKKLGVSLPAGFDPDRKGHKIFTCLHGTVGSPSFTLLDRKGHMAWYLADPRDMDREITRRVIERLLKEKP